MNWSMFLFSYFTTHTHFVTLFFLVNTESKRGRKDISIYMYSDQLAENHKDDWIGSDNTNDLEPFVNAMYGKLEPLNGNMSFHALSYS